jgi:hypothetical protein
LGVSWDIIVYIIRGSFASLIFTRRGTSFSNVKVRRPFAPAYAAARPLGFISYAFIIFCCYHEIKDLTLLLTTQIKFKWNLTTLSSESLFECYLLCEFKLFNHFYDIDWNASNFFFTCPFDFIFNSIGSWSILFGGIEMEGFQWIQINYLLILFYLKLLSLQDSWSNMNLFAVWYKGNPKIAFWKGIAFKKQS